MTGHHNTLTPSHPTIDDFTEGVRWGLFLSSFDADDHPHADYWRQRLLGKIADEIDLHPDLPLKALRPFITDAWDIVQGICHGELEPGEVCQHCGTYDAGDA